MKYENFDKCKEIVEKIKSSKDKLATLESTNPQVEIRTQSGSRIYNLSTEIYYESEYSKEANALVEHIKQDLRDRIKIYKVELEKL